MFIPQKWRFKVLSIVKYQKIQLCFTMQYWHNSKYCANYKQIIKFQTSFQTYLKESIQTHIYMHTIYYIHVIKDIYKSRQFHPPQLCCILTQILVCPEILCSQQRLFRRKRKLNFARTHVNFMLFHKIIRSRSRLIGTGFYESNCSLKTTAWRLQSRSLVKSVSCCSVQRKPTRCFYQK